MELGPLGTNAYLAGLEGADEVFLVDAPMDALEAVEEALAEGGRQRKLVGLLLTHGHWDHMSDGARLRRLGPKVYAHAADKEWIEDPMQQAPFMFPGMRVDPVTVDVWVEAGQEFTLAGLRVQVRHVPGHCPGNVLFYLPDHGCAFVGDALFAGGVGRWDLPMGDWATLQRSIREQIYTLPDDTVILPGHGPTTTVGHEKRSNPFVRA